MVLAGEAAMAIENPLIQLIAKLYAQGAAREAAHNCPEDSTRGSASRAKQAARRISPAGASGGANGSADRSRRSANCTAHLAAVAGLNNAVRVTPRACGVHSRISYINQGLPACRSRRHRGDIGLKVFGRRLARKGAKREIRLVKGSRLRLRARRTLANSLCFANEGIYLSASEGRFVH